MDGYDALADLPLTVADDTLDRRESDTSSGFTRVTTLFELHGDGERGVGEDVTYDTEDHDALTTTRDFDLAGEYTFGEFSAHLDDVDLFPSKEPEREVSRQYRRWAVESAGLDLALRQSGTTLADALGGNYDPVSFVVSTRLGDPPTVDRLRDLLAVHPDLAFKLDPTGEWTPDLAAEVAEVADVRVLDLKGQYSGTVVDNPPDPDLYELVVETFPEAVVEDPALTDETRPILDGHEDRVAWDYPITGVESVEALPFEPEWLNVKPSRFGTVESLLATVAYARERGMTLYGGGQFELDVGREHLHALASLFYPDAPNDVAPSAYNRPDTERDLPASPLSPPSEPAGLRWRDEV
jgi:hypothetical protein